MSPAQFFLTYAVCWWLVLFMVLPHGASPSVKPCAGSGAIRTREPQFTRKFRLTTWLAFLPALGILAIAHAAQAEPSIYKTGDKGACRPFIRHTPDAGILATEGRGIGEKKVVPATLNPSPDAASQTVRMPLRFSPEAYLSGQRNLPEGQSFLAAGEVAIAPDGAVYLNQQAINPANEDAECEATEAR